MIFTTFIDTFCEHSFGYLEYRFGILVSDTRVSYEQVLYPFGLYIKRNKK